MKRFIFCLLFFLTVFAFGANTDYDIKTDWGHIDDFHFPDTIYVVIPTASGADTATITPYSIKTTSDTFRLGGFDLSGTETIDLTITNTTAGGETGLYSYITHTTNALTGELIGVRGNARVDSIASPSGSVIGGKFQAGNMGTGTSLSGARGVYVDVVNKIPAVASATWGVARGFEASMDLNQGSSGHTNTVTLAEGLYVCYNLPTAGSYATVTTGYGAHLKNEAVGGTGQALDAAVYISDASMSGGIHGWDYGIDLSGVASGGFTYSDAKLSSGAKIFTGSAANGDAVYAEVGAYDATGSIYLTTAGALYVQVANAGAATDWFKATTTDAD
jgi:hypothetical protein